MNKTEVLIYPTMQQCKTKAKKVKFEYEELCTLEMCHSLITYGHPNPEQDIE